MARQRYINTDFWRDDYVECLDPLERYLFLYCLTNPLSNIAGIYKISIKRISFETGLDKDMLLKLFNRFKDDEKIMYYLGYVVIKNFIKHQKINPNIQKGINEILKEIPKEIIDWINKPFKGSQGLVKFLNYVNVNDNINNNDNEKKENNIIEIFNYWNSKSNLINHRKLTEIHEKAIKKRIKQYDISILKKCIDNYSVIRNDNYWPDWNWTIDQFFRQDNAFSKFFDECNPLEIYLKNKNEFIKNNKKEIKKDNNNKKDKLAIRLELEKIKNNVASGYTLTEEDKIYVQSLEQQLGE